MAEEKKRRKRRRATSGGLGKVSVKDYGVKGLCLVGGLAVGSLVQKFVSKKDSVSGTDLLGLDGTTSKIVAPLATVGVGLATSLLVKEPHLKMHDVAGDKMIEWLEETISTGPKNPIDDVLSQFDRFFDNCSECKWTDEKKRRYRNGYKNFAESILGIYFANVWAYSDSEDYFSLCDIVAKNAIFASADIVQQVKDGIIGTDNNKGVGNDYASWDNCTHVRDTSCPKGTQKTYIRGNTKITVITVITVITDDNTYANQYIKKAVIESYSLPFGSYLSLRGYEACHIWDLPGDERYYASIANLVLVPRAFGQLTDHCPAVKELLRYEASVRFGFKPEGCVVPDKPGYYDEIKWRKLI